MTFITKKRQRFSDDPYFWNHLARVARLNESFLPISETYTETRIDQATTLSSSDSTAIGRVCRRKKRSPLLSTPKIFSGQPLHISRYVGRTPIAAWGVPSNFAYPLYPLRARFHLILKCTLFNYLYEGWPHNFLTGLGREDLPLVSPHTLYGVTLQLTKCWGSKTPKTPSLNTGCYSNRGHRIVFRWG